MTDHALTAGGNNNANTNANVAPPPITIPRQDEQSGVEPFPSLDESLTSKSIFSISRIGAEGTTRSRGQSSTLSSIRRASKVTINKRILEEEVLGPRAGQAKDRFEKKQRRTSLSPSTISQSGEQEQGRGKNPVGMNTLNNTSPGPELRHDVLPEAVEEEEHSRRPIEADHNLKARSTVTHLDAKSDVLVKPSSSARSSSDTSPLSHNVKYQQQFFFKAFWKFFITPVGFLVTVYGLNVVAWGGPVQIVNGAANIPQSCVAFPLEKSPDAPLTGIRAPPTAMWKLDFVVWTMVWNTFLQAVLSGFMWGLNRYDRPSWSTGLFVALACIVAACGGIMSFMEAKNVKAIEGVPVSDVDREKAGEG
ncbi:hypothetical protein DID88_009905 [Monilinia fructigena]|uniref:Uncharacterized protein n=1 Tax=Monilinia fructigena TaxID=38457 RepID=A0A395IKK1_9HELO|nr:hypothetical protein DID88_009905 [Monilinia fructigena]